MTVRTRKRDQNWSRYFFLPLIDPDLGAFHDPCFDVPFSIPGKQTINRAEAFAALATLITFHDSPDLTLWIDSQITINGINQLIVCFSCTVHNIFEAFQICIFYFIFHMIKVFLKRVNLGVHVT